MASCKCKMCGGQINYENKQITATCEFCGTEQTIACTDDTKKVNLYNRANSLRLSNEFDKALASYEAILIDSPKDAEAHWGICLCRYGIEYVDDPKTNKKIPTCHRTVYNSIFDDIDYKEAIANCDVVAKRIYQAEADVIDKIQKNILSISQKEDPYDVFICYKETDSDGNRTKDSVIAQEIYDALIERGYKVFFSRVTLESKLGTQYEPIIFAALQSSKIMLAIGSKVEYYNAPWVKNEWSRFLSFMKEQRGKYLIPCYKDMEAYDMPDEFLSLQSQNIDKLGFLQDLVRGIDKIFGRSEKEQSEPSNQIGNTKYLNLIKRAKLSLEYREYKKAAALIEEALNENAESAEAYVLLILVEFELVKEDDIIKLKTPLDQNKNFEKALRFADEEYKKKLVSYNEQIKVKYEKERRDKILAMSQTHISEGKYENALHALELIKEDEEAKKLIEDCTLKIQKVIYSRAMSYFGAGSYYLAKKEFERIPEFQDSKLKSEKCFQLMEEAKYEGTYNKAIQRIEYIFSTSKVRIDENAVKSNIALLKEIPEYKDSKERIEKYEKQLVEIKIRIEKEREEKRIENEKRAKEEKERREKAKILMIARIKRFLKIFIPLVVALIILIIITVTVFVPRAKYGKALQMLEYGQVNSAESIFIELDGLKDSEKQLQLITARRLLDLGRYEEAIHIIYSVGGEVHIKYNTNGGTSDMTEEVIKKMNYVTNESNKTGYEFSGWSLNGYKFSEKNYRVDITLEAQYIPEIYTAYFYLNNDYPIPTSIYEYYVSSAPIYVENPIVKGYTFLGWWNSDMEEPVKDLVIETGTVGNLCYTGVWEANKYNIVYDWNDSLYTVTTQEVQYEQSYDLLVPTRQGHKFIGWITTNGIYYSDNWYKLARDLYLTAEWELEEYNISYDLDEGTNNVGNPDVYTYYSEDIILKNPSREGYKFIGWTGEGYPRPTENIVIPKNNIGDLSFKANWEAEKYNIQYDPNGGTLQNTDQIVTYDTLETLPTPERTGYEFLGWFCGDKEFTSGKWTYTDHVTLTAKWKKILYSISFNLDGGTVEGNQTTYDYETETFTLNNPTKKGYTFLGWTGTNIEEPVLEVVIPQNTTDNLSFNANWEANNYTITYNPNGGEMSELSQEVIFGSECNLPEAIRTGYMLVGWKYNNEFVNGYSWDIDEDATLVAQWEPNTYKVTIINNDKIIAVKDVQYELEFKFDICVGNDQQFVGYYTEPDCGGVRITNEEGNSIEPYSYTNNITIYAGYKSRVYLMENGGVEIEDIYYKDNETIPSDIVTTKEGFTFAGWFLDVELTQPLIYTENLGTIVVYAKWEEELSPDHLVYTIADGEVTITGTVDINEDAIYENIILPSHIGGCPVTKLTSTSFNDLSNLKEITIPDTVTMFEEGIFYNCYNLTKLHLNKPQEMIMVPITENGLSSTSTLYTYSSSYFSYSSSTGILNSTNKSHYSASSFVITATKSFTLSFSYSVSSESSYDYFEILHNNNRKAYISGSPSYQNMILNVTAGDTIMFKYSKDGSTSYSSDAGFVKDFVFTTTRLENGLKTIGCLFGTNSFNSATAATQNNKIYYIPDSLVEVELIGFDIIENNFFQNCVDLEKITANNVENIKSDAFENCESLVSFNSSENIINLSNVSIVNANSFKNCTSIIEVVADSLTSIGSYAFAGCSNLEKFNSENSNEIVLPSTCEVVWSNVFQGATNITNLIINDTLGEIKNSAFIGLDSLEKITIPFIGDKSVSPNYTNFGIIFGASGYSQNSIYVPSSLKEVIVTSGESIDNNAFAYCSSLESIVIPNSVTSIGSSAFSGCSSLEELTIPFIGEKNKSSANKDTNLYPLGYIFGSSSYTNSTGISQSYRTTMSGDDTWYTSSNTFYIPNSLKIVNVTNIEEVSYGAFQNCKYIEEINIPDTVTTIGPQAFSHCTNLARLNSEENENIINIPEGITTINSYTFSTCESIIEVSVSDTLKDISTCAFYNCVNLVKFNSTELNELVVPESVVSVDTNAFENCSKIKKVIIPDSVEFIGSSVLAGCSSLEEITLPFIGSDNKTSKDADTRVYPLGYIFGSTSYTGATKTTQHYRSSKSSDGTWNVTTNSYYIPDKLKKVNVTNINEINIGAFENCKYIKEVNVPTTISVIDNYAFSGCTNLSKFNSELDGVYYIPSSVKNISVKVFAECASITEIYLPEKLEKIGNSAFYNCSNIIKFNSTELNELVVPESVVSVDTNAFGNCSKIKKVIIPDSVEFIGSSVLAGCSSLEELTIPFIGEKNKSSANKDTNLYPLGYIFGSSSYTNSTGISQSYRTTMSGDDTWYTSSNTFYIPNSLKIVNVTNIEEVSYGAFRNCYNIEEINIISNATIIDGYAFYNCIALESVNLPETIISVGSYAFGYCSELETVSFPDSVTSIGEYAFYSCSNLLSMNSDQAGVFKMPKNLNIIMRNAFYNCTSMTEVQISDKLEKIEQEAFYGCSNIIKFNSENPFEFIIPDGTISIGYSAFYNLNKIRKVSIPNSVTSLNAGIFSLCSSIEEITLPFIGSDNKTSKDADTKVYPLGYIFGATSYTGATKTTQHYRSSKSSDGTWNVTTNSYYIPDKLKKVNVTNINEINIGAFENCKYIKEVNVPTTISVIDDYAFSGCTNLSKFNSELDGVYYIPSSVKNISVNAFAECASITEIYLPEKLEKIGNSAFYNCSNIIKFNSDTLYELSIPENVISIGSSAFYGLNKIKKAKVADSVTSMGSSAFRNCSSLESITLPFLGDTLDGTTNAYFGYIFVESSTSDISNYGGASLKEVIITKATTIGPQAFYGCTGLESITIPKTVTTIGSQAFYYCTNLARLNSTEDGVFNLPEEVYLISAYMFDGCTSLVKLNMSTNVRTIENNAFNGCTKLSTINSEIEGVVNLPSKVTEIFEYTFSNCSSINEVCVSNKLENIGAYAFSDCENVNKFNSSNSNELNIPAGVLSIGSYAFRGMSLIETIIIPNSIRKMGDYMFSYMTNVKTLTIPFIPGDSTTNIGVGRLFNYSSYSISGMYTGGAYHSYYKVPTSLKTINVTRNNEICDYAFYKMSYLETINLRTNATYSTNTFTSCYATVNYVLSNPLLTEDDVLWDGETVATSYESGSGTQEDPYIISNSLEFMYFISEIKNGNKYTDKYFKLINNIDLANKAFTTEGEFNGKFNGNGHIIDCVILSSLNGYGGLFNILGENGEIVNLGVENISVQVIDNESITYNYYGGLVGYNKGLIENTYVKSSTSIQVSVTNTLYMGGLVGYNSGSIKNSYTNIVFSAKSLINYSYAGGIVGYNNGTIEGCLAIGNIAARGLISAYSFVSHIAGYTAVDALTNCYGINSQVLTKYGEVDNSNNNKIPLITIAEISSTLINHWGIEYWDFYYSYPKLMKH